MPDKNSENICFFNTNRNYGGGEKWHIETATYLSSEFNVFFYAHKNAAFIDKIKSENINITKIRLSNISFLNPFKILHLARQFKAKKITSIIINLPADLKVAGIAAKLAGVRKIIYRRGSAIPVARNVLNNFLFKYVITKILTNSLETSRTITTNFPFLINEEKVQTIYNGIDIEKYDSTESKLIYQPVVNETIIGNAGRLVNQKNQDDLLNIAKILISRGLSFKLLIAGDGILKSDLKRKANELGVEEFVLFLGHVDNIKSFMESIDIFALSSHWEGFGYVLAEAMASSKPLVAFDVSSNPELINDNKNGFLAKKGSLNDFADKLEILIKDHNKRKDFGIEGRRIVKDKFSFQNNINDLISLITS